MAMLVYSGAGNGELFKGKKFFLLQRIPSRDRFKSDITVNGGEVVKLEKQAEFIIGDHARKDQPPGSISWTWIEASLKKGRLEDLENHRINSSSTERGASKSLKTGGGSRTPFTTADDQVLLEWVVKAEANGKGIKGNTIYQELEAANPRHTAQSWRSRWVVYVSHYDRSNIIEQLEREEDEAFNHKPQPIQRRESVPRRKATASVSPPAASVSRARKSVSSGLTEEVTKEVAFTDEETQELEAAYEDIMNIADDKQLNAWLAWADEYPTHKAQDWRNYFYEYVVPRQRNKEKKAREKQVKNKLAKDDQVRQKSATRTVTGKSQTTSAIDQKPPVTMDPNSSPVIQPEQTSQVTDVKHSNRDPTLDDPVLFKDELVAFLAQYPPDETLQWSITLADQDIDLFRIWQVVKTTPFLGYDKVENEQQWPVVAKELGVNKWQTPEVGERIAEYYEMFLVDFEDFREKHKAQFAWYQDDVEDEIMIQNQLFPTSAANHLEQNETESQELQDDADADEEQNLQATTANKPPSSYRLQKKRALDSSPYSTSQSISKRRKIDTGKGKEIEIPYSPDLISKYSSNTINYKPSATTPSKSRAFDDDDQELADNTPSRQPNFKTTRSGQRTKQIFLEPETQDFPSHNHETLEFSSELSSPRIPTTAEGGRRQGSQSSPPTPSPIEAPDLAAMEQFIEESISLGYKEKVVMDALAFTSMDFKNARFIMERLRSGEGVPDDLQGVWTKKDDEALSKPKESKQYGEVVRKHGIAKVKERKGFLATWNI